MALTQPSGAIAIQSVDDSFGGTAPSTKEHMALYCAFVLGIKIPSIQVCSAHSSPLDALWDAYADETSFAIWHAMRGSGKTLLLAILAHLESKFKPRCGVTILGGSLEQSQKAMAYSDELWRRPGAGAEMLVGGAVAGRGYKLTNGSWVAALAASQRSVRGPHPQRLRLDEVDEMSEEIFNAALGQPKANYGIPDQVVASSTLHHPFGMMATLIDAKEERGADIYRWCVEEVRESAGGFWSDDEIARKKRQVTEAMWDAEYMLKRPSVGHSVFDFEAIERAYQRGRSSQLERRGTVEAGIDWGHTYTVMHIIQDTKERYIHVESYRWEMVELTERCQQICDICAQSGVSTVYADIAPKDSNVTLLKIMRKNRVRSRLQSVAFSKWKGKGIDIMRYLLEKDLIDIADPVAKEKLQRYRYKNVESELIEKVDDHDTDAFIAWAVSKDWVLGR